MDQKLESTACDLKHVFISVSKGNYPDVSSGDTITIPVTVKFSVSHRRQKHLAVYIVSNEMWKVRTKCGRLTGNDESGRRERNWSLPFLAEPLNIT